MSTLSDLRASLRYWKDIAEEQRKLKSNLNQRKKELEKIKQDLENIGRNDSNDVNKRHNGIVNHLQASVKSFAIDMLLSNLVSKVEGDCSADPDLSSANEELGSAIRTISSQIDEAEESMKRANRESDYYSSAIKREEERIEAERRQQEAERRREAHEKMLQKGSPQKRFRPTR